MDETRAAIAFYDERGWNWSQVVAYIGICQQFGSWQELHDSLSPWSRRMVATKRKRRERRSK